MTKERSGFYAATNWKTPEGKHTTKKMHVLLFPDLGKVRDHIDRNTQDNREANLRCGDHGVNSRNTKMQSNNTSGTKGVSPIDGGYMAQYNERGGKQVTRRFLAHNCGTDAEAKHQAIGWREVNATKAFEDCLTRGGERGGSPIS